MTGSWGGPRCARRPLFPSMTADIGPRLPFRIMTNRHGPDTRSPHPLQRAGPPRVPSSRQQDHSLACLVENVKRSPSAALRPIPHAKANAHAGARQGRSRAPAHGQRQRLATERLARTPRLPQPTIPAQSARSARLRSASGATKNAVPGVASARPGRATADRPCGTPRRHDKLAKQPLRNHPHPRALSTRSMRRRTRQPHAPRGRESHDETETVTAHRTAHHRGQPRTPRHLPLSALDSRSAPPTPRAVPDLSQPRHFPNETGDTGPFRCSELRSTAARRLLQHQLSLSGRASAADQHHQREGHATATRSGRKPWRSIQPLVPGRRQREGAGSALSDALGRVSTISGSGRERRCRDGPPARGTPAEVGGSCRAGVWPRKIARQATCLAPSENPCGVPTPSATPIGPQWARSRR